MGERAAAPGTHDDCVMAMAIAWAVRGKWDGRSRWRSKKLKTLSMNEVKGFNGQGGSRADSRY